MNVDDQLRRAGDRLNVELEQLPIPYVPQRWKQPWRTLVTALVVAIVVGGPVLWVTRGRNGEQPAPGEPPPATSTTRHTPDPGPGEQPQSEWDRWEPFGAEVARLQFSWETDLGLDTDSDVWPQRLQDVCETELTLDAFGDLGERFVGADLEAGRNLAAAGPAKHFGKSNLARQLLWEFALDVCVAQPLTEPQDFNMVPWIDDTCLWESPEWPGRFEEVCALDPTEVKNYEALAERYVAEDVVAGMWLGRDEYVPPPVEEIAETLWIMAVSPEPRDVCPEHALSGQRPYDESTSMFGSWHLVRYVSDNETVEPIGDRDIGLFVDLRRSFTGSLGCNNYILQTEHDGTGAIDVTRFWATHRLCSEPAGIMSQEDVLVSLLKRVISIELTGDGLELITETGDRLTWSR